MDIVKALSQKRYKRFEDSGAEPHYRANNDDAHGVPEAAPSEAPRVTDAEERKFVTAGPRPNVQVIQITESLSLPPPPPPAVTRTPDPPPPAVPRVQEQSTPLPDPLIAVLQRRVADLQAQLALLNQRNADLLRQLAEREAQWGQDRLGLVSDLEQQKALFADQEVDLRVARNAERRAKEVLGLKQSELEEAQGKLSTYARMYGHANMERMAKLTARVAELEEALALSKPEGPQETASGSDQVVSLRRQLRIATKDKARLLQQNRSLSARMSATGSFDLDLEGSQLSSSRTASARSSPHPESPAASSGRGSADGTVPPDPAASAPQEPRAPGGAQRPDRASNRASLDREADAGPPGEAAALRVRVRELEQEADALRSELRDRKPVPPAERRDSNDEASPPYPSSITSFKLASSDALREKLHALMAEGRLKGGRAASDGAASRSGDGVAPPNAGQGSLQALQRSLEVLERTVREATQGESPRHRVATLEATIGALQADLAGALEALEAAKVELRRSEAGRSSSRKQVLDSMADVEGELSWQALAAASSGSQASAPPSPHHRRDSQAERLAQELETSNVALKELAAQHEAEMELQNQKAEMQEQLVEEERARRRRLEQEHEDALQQLEAARAELAVLRQPVQARAAELGSLREVNVRLSRQLEDALRSLQSREPPVKEEVRTAEEEAAAGEAEVEAMRREHREAVREVEEVRRQQEATSQRLALLQEELDVLQAAKAALHAQVESSSKLREHQVGSASAQVEALRADLEKAEAQLAEAQAQLLSMRKARLEEAESAAAQLRAFKMEARRREDELLSANPALLRPPSPASRSPVRWSTPSRSPPGHQTEAEPFPVLRHVAGAPGAPQGEGEASPRHAEVTEGDDSVGALRELPPLAGVRRTVSEPEQWSRRFPGDLEAGSPHQNRIVINPRAGDDGTLEAQLAAARKTITALQSEVRAKRGQLESAAGREDALRESLLQQTSEAKRKGAELEAASRDLQALRVKHNDLAAEFAAYKKGMEEAGASSWRLQQLEARLAQEVAAHAQAREQLPALQKAAEEAAAGMAAAVEDADAQRRDARAAAIKAEERGVEIEGLRAEVRRTEARLRGTQANLAAQQDKAELQARMTRQYVEEFERERALRHRLQGHVPEVCKQALLLKQQLEALVPQLPALKGGADVAASLERALSQMKREDEEPRQSGRGSMSEDADHMGGVTLVSVQSVLQLEAQRRFAEAEAIRSLFASSHKSRLPGSPQGREGPAGETGVQADVEGPSPAQLKVELDQTRQKAVDFLRERIHLEQCVRYLAVRAGLAIAVDRNAGGVSLPAPSSLDDSLAEAEGGEAAEGAALAAGTGGAGGEGGPLGLLLSKELKDVRNRGREAVPESGTAPQVEQGILTKVAALCATAGSSQVSPWKRGRQGEAGEEMTLAAAGSPPLTPRDENPRPSILMPSPLSRFSKGRP